ncbi:MAG: hypothetical protein PHN69_02450 [Candidatus Pacebacteria bacterium]|nr:hypothetical protein [Candidatus Paceibacterota bacterium]
MVTTIRDVSQLQGRPEYDTAILTPLLVLMVNNGFVGEEVFNIVQSLDNISYSVETFNDKFSLADRISEAGGPQNTDFDTELKEAKTFTYNLSSVITAEQARNKNLNVILDLTAKKMNAIGERLRMNRERDLINALLDTTTYSGIQVYSASTAWTTISTCNPMKDIIMTADKIASYGYEADAIILGRGDETNLALSDKLVTLSQYTKDITADGIERKKLFGYDLYVSNARYNAAGTMTRLLSGKAIMLKKGVSGEIRESQPYLADSDYDKKRREMVLLGTSTAAPIVTYESTVGIISDIA